MILEQGEAIVNLHTEHKIKRKRRAGWTVSIVSEPQNKRYKISIFKRRRMHEHSSVSLGDMQSRYRGESRVTARHYMGTISISSNHLFVWCVAPVGQACSRFAFASCENSKHYILSLRSAVESYGDIVRVAPSSLGSWPRRNKFVFSKECQQTLKRQGNQCLIILDELLNVAHSKELCYLFMKGSNHRNISDILITQNLFHQGKFCRDISLNAKYIVVLKNVRDRLQFSHLARKCTASRQ